MSTVRELQSALEKKTVAAWEPAFDGLDLPWSPIFDGRDVAADEQARVNQYILRKQHRSGQSLDVIGPPFQLRDHEALVGPAPETGQHTEEVMLELGYSWEDIARIREAGGN